MSTKPTANDSENKGANEAGRPKNSFLEAERRKAERLAAQKAAEEAAKAKETVAGEPVVTEEDKLPEPEVIQEAPAERPVEVQEEAQEEPEAKPEEQPKAEEKESAPAENEPEEDENDPRKAIQMAYAAKIKGKTEAQTERIQVATTPTIKSALKELEQQKKIKSMNHLINSLLKMYLGMEDD